VEQDGANVVLGTRAGGEYLRRPGAHAGHADGLLHAVCSLGEPCGAEEGGVIIYFDIGQLLIAVGIGYVSAGLMGLVIALTAFALGVSSYALAQRIGIK